MTRIHRLADDLILIDTHYHRTSEAIGAYLLLGERPALVETGPASTLEALLEGVREAGLDPRHLQAVAVTHIHLDHAGAAGALVQRVPHLDVYVHPIGAPHMVDPSRLTVSARRIYGDELESLLGEPVAIPAERVQPLEDGAEVRLGSRRLRALATPGHARHHLVFYDEGAGDLFTGDAAGVSLPGSRYVRPPTPPPELDVPAWDQTLERLRALRPRRLLLTHFGSHTWADELLAQLQRRLHTAVECVRTALDAGLDEAAITDRLRAAAEAEMGKADGAEAARRLEIIMAARISALGLMRYLRGPQPRVESAGGTGGA